MDWLDVENKDVTEKQRAEGLRIAMLYTIFETTDAGRELLALWDTALLRRRTPVNAPITEYAANEALRAFVAGIHDQIKLARELGK